MDTDMKETETVVTENSMIKTRRLFLSPSLFLR